MRLLVALVIFLPPQGFNFSLKPVHQLLVGAKLKCSHCPHEVAMMVPMAVVIAEHAAIVPTADPRIDVGETVLHHLPLIPPDFFLENSAATPASEVAGVVNDLLRFGSLPSLLPDHGRSIAQLGYYKSCLWQESAGRVLRN
jgi:hypothetical protein